MWTRSISLAVLVAVAFFLVDVFATSKFSEKIRGPQKRAEEEVSKAKSYKEPSNSTNSYRYLSNTTTRMSNDSCHILSLTIC